MFFLDLKRPLCLRAAPLLDSVVKIKKNMSQHGELKKCQGDAAAAAPDLSSLLLPLLLLLQQPLFVNYF